MRPLPQHVTEIPDVGLQALTVAREEIDQVLWRRDIRAAAAEVARASRIMGGRASAHLDGADLAQPEDSAMGRVLTAALAVTTMVPDQVDTWARAPGQVVAQMHAVVARVLMPVLMPDDDAGRPRSTDEADDPLLLGDVPTVAALGERLRAWMQWWSGSARDLPALAVAAITHAEVMVWRPFTHGTSLIARALPRVVMAERGVDPALFTVPEEGMLAGGRPAYRNALIAYREGDLENYLVWAATAFASGAQAASTRIPGETESNSA